ncbi:carboxypeptidase-like regulatory domain-containing protein, partial [Duncaniella freteri]|uniref:carboxypeptidase-like regulatory domain-containing protein n=8 Tax=Duncaniella TaxID=2518495 RepID=UPI002576D030
MSKIGMRFAASLAVICLYMGGVNLIDAQTVTTAESTKNNVYRGVVIDEEGEPLPGVSVIVVGKKAIGTATDVDGNFIFNYSEPKARLKFTYVGMKPQEIRATAGNKVTVRLENDATTLGETVVNGIYTRNIESFTGSVSTFRGDDLKAIAPQGILKSLAILDPSIVMTDNTQFGSNPNQLADISINGKMNVQALSAEYETDPNQPLFILDGFESTLQTISDLNMDRVESISVLKDASATAIYGSKAANGVIVVETKKPSAGRLRLTYNGSIQVGWADLSDYNLMDANDKLRYELLSGEYDGDKGL